MADDREMSRFLYRLTQEIVTSRDFSDTNINSICEKYYRNSTYRDKARLARTIADLKDRLQVENMGFISDSSLLQLPVLSDHCCCTSTKSLVKNIREQCDKGISAQSFSKLPGMKINKYSQCQESIPCTNELQQHRKPLIEANTNIAAKSCSSELTIDSISTITTYNFPSSMYTSPQSINLESLAKLDFAIEQISSTSEAEERYNGEPMEGCFGKGTKKSTDSSADMAMRMAASDRLLQSGHKCPLHHCERFDRLASSSAGLPGGCGGGCASDFPVPKLDSEESQQATCCGRTVKKKKKSGPKKKQTSKTKQSNRNQK
ncbi:uncharacterized protein LOC129732329 isoform X2 [Wyeomyia smithii]|nr:uncharacterized protein LOC129732329 isoform X2 [Wyeomyia smithii]